MKNFKKIYFTIVAVLTMTLSSAQISKAEIQATGLTCSMCSNAINKQLKSMPEVANVDTDLNTNTFTVTLKPNNNLTPKNFKDNIEKAGFFIGSLIITIQSEAINNKNFIMVNDDKTSESLIKIQVLDKGFVTNKAYKKLMRTYKKIGTYATNNEADFHIKIIK